MKRGDEKDERVNKRVHGVRAEVGTGHSRSREIDPREGTAAEETERKQRHGTRTE